VILSGSRPWPGHSRRCGNFSAPGTGFRTSGALHLGQVCITASGGIAVIHVARIKAAALADKQNKNKRAHG
jgi:hypothetical protein